MQALAAAEEELNAGPLNPEVEQRKRALAAALQAQNPALQVFPFRSGEIAAAEGVSEAAREKWRHLELNGPEDGNGIQITLFDETASVTVPYWHNEGDASVVWREIWAYLTVLEQKGSFHTHDPQLERVLDLTSDQSQVLSKYLEGASFTRGIAARALPEERPWWKFW